MLLPQLLPAQADVKAEYGRPFFKRVRELCVCYSMCVFARCVKW